MEVSDFISIVMMLIAVASTVITYTVYRSNSDPDVIVYVELDRKRAGLLLLIVKNIGKGPAVDIRFNTSRSLPQEAFNSDRSMKEMSSGALVIGVSYLAPGQELILTWGQYGALKKWLGTGTVDVTSDFTRPRQIRPFSSRLRSSSKLDITQFERSDASDHNWGAKLVEQAKANHEHLAKIAKVLESSRDGS